MRRWLVLPLGIGIAALAGYVLLTGANEPPAGGETTGAADAPHDEIDEESRERLRAILRDANGQEVAKP